jgi:hypothetical protein
MHRKLARTMMMAVLATSFVSCARKAQQTTAAPAPPPQQSRPATAPAETRTAKDASGGKFTYAPAGIELSWPDGWQQTKKEDYEWAIEPARDAGERWISLDVPTLPLHPPGLIPISKVESGYLDDLKKQNGSLDVKELTPPPLPDAKLRMVRAAWQKDGKSFEQTALLIVHADHVYIIRAHSDADHEQPTRETFDSVTKSIQWIKKK